MKGLRSVKVEALILGSIFFDFVGFSAISSYREQRLYGGAIHTETLGIQKPPDAVYWLLDSIFQHYWG